ncbi:MAG: dockerin type I repeat-containing protein [Clostridia bacterium]|nr:dockerin type I repeat-containing protein [Clostridia bacterium]
MKSTFSRLPVLFVMITAVLTLFSLNCSAALTEAPDGFTAVTTADELAGVSADGSYILLADIDLSGTAFTPIGSTSSPFTGVFDGNGHKITGLDITSDGSYTALFAYCDAAEIKDLSVEGSSITVISVSDVYASVICAKAVNGTVITDCYTNASVSVTSEGDVYASGICAYADGTSITNSASASSVTVTTSGGVVNIGGIASYLFADSKIEDCKNSGLLTGESADELYVGGIVGTTKRDLNNTSRAKPTVKGSKNTADISIASDDNISISCAGIAAKAENLVISECMNTGNISAEAGLGATASGIAGYHSRNTLDKCANTGNISAVSTAADAYASGIIAEANVSSVTDCYNTGSIFAEGKQSSNSGGICGHCTQIDSFETSYNTGSNLSLAGTSAGTLIGASAYNDTRASLYTLESETHPAIGNREDTSAVTVLTSEQMASQDSFPGFDFDTVWYMSEDGSGPMLSIFKEAPTPVYGDVDGNGAVESNDTVTLARYFAKWSGYTDIINEANSDLNGDGNIDSTDNIILARYFAKWSGYETLPIA